MAVRTAASVMYGVALGIGAVIADEVRAGNGMCLLGRHDWWYCQVDAPDHQHKHCRRCGADR